MDVTVTVRQDGASAVLEAIGVSDHIRKVARAAAEAIADAARNAAMAKGGRRFWREIANSVSYQPDGDGMEVFSNHFAAGFKQTGGTISAPGRGAGSLHRRALAIPLGIARQRRWDTDRAKDAGWSLFRVGKGEGDRSVLMGARGRGKRAQTLPLFALRRSVTQAPDPWFPQGAALSAAVADGISRYASGQGGLPL